LIEWNESKPHLSNLHDGGMAGVSIRSTHNTSSIPASSILLLKSFMVLSPLYSLQIESLS
jgi:hypothetical protein